jgi:hypothetical protein
MPKCIPRGVSGDDEMTEEGALPSPDKLVLSRCMAGGMGRLPCMTGEISCRGAMGCIKAGSMAGESNAGAIEVISWWTGWEVMTMSSACSILSPPALVGWYAGISASGE